MTETPASENRTDDRLDALWIAVVGVDGDGIVRTVNLAAERLLGAQAPSIGRQAPTDAKWWRSAVEAGPYDPDATPPAPVRLVAADGSLRWLKAHAVPRDGGGTVVLLEDVTDSQEAKEAMAGAAAIRSQLVQQLDDVNERLARANGELRRFAGAVAHDLQGPLTNMLGFVQLLPTLAADLGPDGERLAARIEDNARRSLDMVSDLLAYARTVGSPRDAETVVLGEVMAWVADATAADRDAVGAALVHGGLPTVLGNEAALRQVFLNLIDNAIKYRRQAVAPRIEVRPVASPDPELAEVHVIDNGRGIDVADRLVVFRLGARLAERGLERPEGSGIGLASCEAVVSSLGGTIHIGEPPLGGGTRVVVRLPHASVLDDAVVDRAGTVMVVDDDPDAVQVVRLFVRTLGLEVVAAAGTKAEAAEIFGALTPPPDIVVLDLALPDGDGLEVAQALLAVRPDQKILMHSSHVDPAVVDKARRIGVAEVVGKGIGNADFADALRRAVDARR